MAEVFDIVVPNQMMGQLADDIELTLEGIGVGAGITAADKDLANNRLNGFDAVAQVGIVDRNVAPAEKNLAFVFDGRLDRRGTGV